jgi:hypothetical protein
MSSINLPEVGARVLFRDSLYMKNRHGIVVSNTGEYCIFETHKKDREPTYWKYIDPLRVSKMEHKKISNGHTVFRVPVSNDLNFLKNLFCKNCFLLWDLFFPSTSSAPTKSSVPLQEINLLPPSLEVISEEQG